MKSFFHFLKAIPLALAFFLFMPEAQATHYMGVDITYSCLPGGNGCTYRVFHNTYYDCAGAATTPLPGPPFPPTISFQPTTCQQPTAVGAWQFVSYVEVTPICIQAATQCTQNGATINGVLEARFYRDYNFCNVNCTVYNITWGTCCRNGSITSGAANDGIYSGNTQINLGFTPCNSSPQFSTPPVPYVCAGSPFTFNQGAFDPDGDSLVYVLSPCQDNATTQVGYAGGFSPTQPLGPSWNVSLNSGTGDITITPNPGNVLTGVLCVTVEEYRNGVKIGEVTRDIQVTVINCGSNSPPTLTALTNVQGAVQTAPYTLNVCPNNPVSFDISGTDPDQNDSLLLFWNVVTAPMGATFTAAGNTAITDTVPGSVTTPPVGRFNWTPTTPGLYNVTLTIQDNGCPLFTSNQITVVIDVSNAQLAPTISTRRVGCYDIEFTVDAGGGCPPFDLTFDPGDNTAPITTQITSAIWTYVHSYPAIPTPNTYGFSASFVDFGLNTAIAQGSVTISNTAIANAGPDLALCPGQSGVIGTGAQPGHTYQWRGLTTNLGLPNGAGRTNARPPVSLNNTTNSPISIDYEVTAIDSVGCVSLDTVNVSYNPKPAPTFTATPEVCQGEAATVTYTGIRRPGTTYNWNFGTGTSTSGTIGVGPHNVFWSPPISGLQTIILTTTVNGCTSDAVSQVVEVKRIPTSGFTVISPICEGQASILTYTGNSGPSATAIWDLDGGNVVAGNINGLDPLTVTWNTPGPKIISLTVDDRNCIGPTVVDTVVVNAIPSSDFSNPVSLCQGDSAQFVYLGNAATTAAYTWDFAGGGSNPATASQGPYNVSWSTPGVKRVCLNVQDKGCFSPQTCKNVQVYETPQARIDPVSDVCFAGGANSVAFTYSGTPGVSTYNWDFGFGSTPRTSNVPNPANIRYLSTGIKTVSLVVANNGCISDTFTTTFEVIPEPKADFIVNSNSTICSNDSITFTLTAPAVGPGQTYFWRFGNNSSPATSSLPNPGGVTYTSGGVKTISLVADYRGCRDVKATQLRVEESPMLSAGQSIEFCEGAGGAQINATTTGGTPTYTYLWRCSAPSCGLSSNIVEDPFVNPLAFAPQTIQYYGQAVDAKGCRSNIDTVDVTVHPKPKVDAGRDTVMCEGGIGVTLKGSLAFNNRAAGPFSYQWTDDRGNFPPNGMVPPNDKRLDPYTVPNQTTIYTLVVTDLTTGCDSRTTTVDPLSTVEVQVIPQPIAHAGPDTVMCFGDFITLNGFGSGGDGTYTYAWSPTNTGFINSPTRKDPTISPQQTTTYTLVVTSEGCESDGDQVEVIVYAEPTADAGDEKDICLGDTVTLDGRVSGDLNDPAYSFVWVPATGLNDPMLEKPDASPQTTTLYKLIATSDFGCGTDTSEVTVTVNSTPIVEATSVDTVICKGDEIQLSAQHSFITTAPGGPVVYLWTPASTVVDGIFSQTPTVKPNLTTLYKVKASIGDCFTTDEVLVTVIPGVEAGVTATDSTICAGDVTTLTATGGIGDAKFYWTPGLSLNDSLTAEVAASPAVTTTYNLRVEEGLCADDTSITITVYPTPSSDYLHSIPEGCEGLEVNFMENTTDAVSFIWDFGDGTPLSNEANPNHVYDEPGEYPVSLTAIGAFGCESTTQKATIRISEGSFADFTSTPNFDTEVPLPDATVAFEDLSANAVSWLWDFGDGSSSSEQNPTHTYQSPLDPADPSKGYEVTLTVTDANGCKSSIAYGPYLIINPDLFVPNVFTPNGDGINDEFLVIYNGSENYQLTVFDRWGGRIFQSDVPGEPWLGQTNNGNIATEGVYYYTIQIGNKTHKGNISLLR
jgi:gliding motility-associated-like protein